MVQDIGEGERGTRMLHCREMRSSPFSTGHLGLPGLDWGAVGVFRQAPGQQLAQNITLVREEEVAGKIVRVNDFLVLMAKELLLANKI